MYSSPGYVYFRTQRWGLVLDTRKEKKGVSSPLPPFHFHIQSLFKSFGKKEWI